MNSTNQPAIKTIVSDLLTQDQQTLLNNLRGAYPSVPSGMTDYQIEMFVLNAAEFPTWYCVYNQCLLESWTRFKSILSRLQGLETERLKMNVKQERAALLYEEGTHLSIATAKLVEHQIRVNEQNQTISLHELQNSFHELETFERIRKIAEKHFDEIPKWGDQKQEEAKWALRFLFGRHVPRSSLVAGSMEESAKAIPEVVSEENMRLLHKFFPPQDVLRKDAPRKQNE